MKHSRCQGRKNNQAFMFCFKTAHMQKNGQVGMEPEHPHKRGAHRDAAQRLQLTEAAKSFRR